MKEEKGGSLVGRFRIGAAEEISALILEQDGRPCIDIRIHHLAPNGHSIPTDKGVRIPATLLPELKRMVQGMEEKLVEQGLSDEFQNLEQLREERGIIFAHPSEREFARILDFYKLRWEYEPKTFPIQWDQEGHILESFTPDFYLPEQDLYIELTTRKQSLVTKKNRKLRLRKQFYPQVNIKIFYGRDFTRLLQKYGRREEKT